MGKILHTCSFLVPFGLPLEVFGHRAHHDLDL